jgi:hypothetical protein
MLKRSMFCGLLMVLAALSCVSCGLIESTDQVPAGAFNVRIVSDSVPDFSSRENFVYSVMSNWPTDAEKCLAQFRWMHRCRRVGSYVPEDGRPVLDPILFFNSYGITFCSMISEMNVSFWEAAGYPGRPRHINDHVVSEVKYGGAWHMFDNDFCNYFINAKGEVASVDELHAGRQRVPGRHYIYDHCPVASCVGGRIFMGPSSATIEDVAKEWYKELRSWGRGDPGSSGAQAGHRFTLGLIPDAVYSRYWQPLGTGDLYARPMPRSGDPATRSTLKNSRSNGRWEWNVDVRNAATLFGGDNVTVGTMGVGPEDPNRKGVAIYRLAAANIMTSATIRARVTGDAPVLQVSGDGGQSWHPLKIEIQPGKPGVVGTTAAPVAGRLDLLLRVELSGASRLVGLAIEAITQTNPRTLPALRLGKNTVVAVAEEQLETVTLNPRLSAGQHEKEVFSTRGFRPLGRITDTTMTIEATGPSELVLKAEAPRDIRWIQMNATMHLTKPERQMTTSVSFDDGKTWRQIGRQGYTPDRFWDYRTSDETRDIPPGTRKVLLRYAFNGDGTGLVNVVAYVGYSPAGRFAAYDVTYAWDEWHDGAWKPFEHRERVAGRYHRFEIPVGGSRPPRMRYIRTALAGDSPAPVNPPRDIAPDHGAPFRLEYGAVVSKGASYQVSRPAGQAYPDKNGKVLTDGYVGLASYWGLGKINLTGEKNKGRVGELVAWEPGDEVLVTLDLGKRRPVGGARIAAVQPNAQVLYPKTMTVEISDDGKTFRPVGHTTWEACFHLPADQVEWEGTDSPIYAGLPAGGITDFKFPILFEDALNRADKPMEARYVRFRLAKPEDPKAGIGLWELEVYDTLRRVPYDERLQLPEPPK